MQPQRMRKHSIKRPRSECTTPLDVAVLNSPLRSERNERASLSESILIEGISIPSYLPSTAFYCSYKIALLFHLLHQTVAVSFAHYFVFPKACNSSTTSRLTLDDSRPARMLCIILEALESESMKKYHCATFAKRCLYLCEEVQLILLRIDSLSSG